MEVVPVMFDRTCVVEVLWEVPGARLAEVNPIDCAILPGSGSITLIQIDPFSKTRIGDTLRFAFAPGDPTIIEVLRVLG